MKKTGKVILSLIAAGVIWNLKARSAGGTDRNDSLEDKKHG